MKVGDQLSLYTELYGWLYYDTIWQILVASGLVLLPFAVIVVRHLIDQRENASAMEAQSDSIMAGLEVKLFVALLVVAVAAIPTIPVSPESFSFDRKADAFSEEAVADQTQGNTGTTYDAVASPRDGTTVEVPAFWYGVSAISHGITYAVRSQVDERGKAFAAIKRAGEIISSPDPAVAQQLQRFHNECYAPALKMHYDAEATRAQLFPDRDVNNPVDEGDVSGMLYDSVSVYYPQIRTRDPVAGVEYTAENFPEATTAQPWGKPTCDAYRDIILDEVRADPDYQQSVAWYSAAFQALAIPFTEESLGSQTLQRYVNSARVSYVSDADRDVERGKTYGVLTQVGRDASAVAAVAGNAVSILGLSAMVDSIIFGLHQLRAVLMLVVIMAIPIGLVLSMYNTSFLLQGSVVLFSITFINALWAIASWVEGTLFAAVMPTTAEIFNQWPTTTALKYAAIHFTSLLLYTMMPIAFFWMLSAAGSKTDAASSMAMHGRGTGLGPASKIPPLPKRRKK